MAVDPVGEGPILDVGHAVSCHPHGHVHIDVEASVDGVEERAPRRESGRRW